MGEGKCRPPTAPKFLDRLFWNSNLRNMSEKPPCTSNLVKIGIRGWAGRTFSLSILLILPFVGPKAQYTPPTPTRRNCRVSSRRRCVHEFATSWRQFRRVVGVNTPVGIRELGHGRRLRCAFATPKPSAVVAIIHVHTADADAMRQNSFVSSASAVCIGHKFFGFCILRTVSWLHRWTDYDARWFIARVFRQRSVFWGSQWWKVMSKGVDWKCRTWKWRTIKIARREIAGHEIDGPIFKAFARH